MSRTGVKSNSKCQNFTKLINFKSNPIDIQFTKILSSDSYTPLSIVNTFCVFKTIDDLLCLIFSNKINSLISYNLIDNKTIIEIKKAHKKTISNIKYYFDSNNKRDLVISISFWDYSFNVWNVHNWENLVNIKKDFQYLCWLHSACILNYINRNYIITCNNNYELLRVYDFNGKEIRNIYDMNQKGTFFIDTFYDNKSFKAFIITASDGFCKAYDYDGDKLYKKYSDEMKNYDIIYNSIIINNNEEVIKMIASSNDGNIRIWDFNSSILLKK